MAEHPGTRTPTDAILVEVRGGPSKRSDAYSAAKPNREWHAGNAGPSSWATRDAFRHGHPHSK